MSDTVRVRIAVAVDVDGKWEAVGWNDAPDAEMVARAKEEGFFDDSDPLRVVLVEAEVTLPEWPQTIEGEVATEPEGGR